MSDSPRILVVDDDHRIRAMLRRYLVEEGFLVSEAADGVAMRATLESEKVDLVLLDLVMEGEDGLSLARGIRQRSEIPVIILTGKGDLIDRVVGLEAGADDYIAKPFHLREVLARIRTVMRRARPPAASAAPSAPPVADEKPGRDIILFDGWKLDLMRRELRRANDEIVPLTTGEFDLLNAFASHPNRVLGRDQLMDLVKGRDWAAYDRTIDTQIVRLRRKIEDDPSQPKLIKTVRGAGYVFATSVIKG
jgi:two-component system OmpR family response regulator